MNKLVLFTCFLFLFFLGARAQTICGFDLRHQTLMKSDDRYARQHESTRLQIKQIIDQQTARDSKGHFATATVVIPVVVHVMHTGGAVGTVYNPSDEQIFATIDYLNKIYAGTWPGMTAPAEGGGIVNMGIQFSLAQRTPTCAVTSGIVRTDASVVAGYVTSGCTTTNELAMKNLSRWDPSKYYNIWVVNKIPGAAGFAYTPGSSPSLDGTVLISDVMAADDPTLPHEIGHAFGLYHTFFGGCITGDCSIIGDAVCDTDPVTSSGNCRTGFTNACTGTPYLVNTENNFMGYSKCHTLFTNGQKARAQASLSLPCRSSLIDPSNLALIPCGSQIRFNKATGSHAEDITAPIDGCRRYRDYAYTMSISEAPLATATVTLSTGGSAVRGIDYELTTNGSFLSPSNIITFNTGSTATQTFTIRVFDDAQLEPTENILLDFLLDNGGGNAIKGNKPSLNLTIADNDIAPDGSAILTYNIGNSSGSGASFFDVRQKNRRVQFQYKASELVAAGITAGPVTSIALFFDTKLSSKPFQNFNIKMGHSSVPYLVNSGVSTEVTGLTSVYSSASLNTISGLNRFNFSTPFLWDGVRNITIEMCFDNGAADASNLPDFIKTFTDGGTATQGNYLVADVNCSQSLLLSYSYYSFGEKPDIQFGKNTPIAPVETALAANTDLHIQPGSDEYFYSGNNKLIMKMCCISHTLNCVNVRLQEAGDIWHSYHSGSRSAKVFRISPAINGSTTSYSLSFYFTNAELSGKNPATLNIARTTASTVSASNGSNTEFKTPVISSMGADIKVFTATFTGSGSFFLVDGNVSLPVTIADFKGKLNDHRQTILTWLTVAEQKFSHFDIEHSRTGSGFTRIGKADPKSTSSQQTNYEFVHSDPVPGLNYYRLKQVDKDGEYEYSRIISVNLIASKVDPVVYPVPAKDQIHVDFRKKMSAGVFEIFTADMKFVQRGMIKEGSQAITIKLNQLIKGIYLVRYSDGELTSQFKFIKE